MLTMPGLQRIGERLRSVQEDAAKVAEEEGECAAGCDEQRTADGRGAVEDGGRHFEADAGADVVQAAVIGVPPLRSALLLRGELHALPTHPPVTSASPLATCNPYEFLWSLVTR